MKLVVDELEDRIPRTHLNNNYASKILFVTCLSNRQNIFLSAFIPVKVGTRFIASPMFTTSFYGINNPETLYPWFKYDSDQFLQCGDIQQLTKQITADHVSNCKNTAYVFETQRERINMAHNLIKLQQKLTAMDELTPVGLSKIYLAQIRKYQDLFDKDSLARLKKANML